jgi:hypothetical protein
MGSRARFNVALSRMSRDELDLARAGCHCGHGERTLAGDAVQRTRCAVTLTMRSHAGSNGRAYAGGSARAARFPAAGPLGRKRLDALERGF